MKKINKKIRLFLALFSIALIKSGSYIYAAGESPEFDNAEAQKAILKITEPITTLAMWLIPIITAIVLLWSGISWMMKDEDEKEQKPYKKTAKIIIIVAVILESVPVLLRIFGIS